jgi:hypothetical protein
LVKATAFRIRNDDRISAFHYGNDGVRRAQIDSNYLFGHNKPRIVCESVGEVAVAATLPHAQPIPRGDSSGNWGAEDMSLFDSSAHLDWLISVTVAYLAIVKAAAECAFPA